MANNFYKNQRQRLPKGSAVKIITSPGALFPESSMCLGDGVLPSNKSGHVAGSNTHSNLFTHS